MKNFIANGDSLQLIAPAGGVVGGSPVKQGSLIGIPVASAAENDQFTLSLKGAFSDLPKAAGEVWAVGDMVYWSTANSNFTKTVGANTFGGYAYDAALSAAVVGSVLLSH
jgi:predicted RecA/RadA family phage recombinase